MDGMLSQEEINALLGGMDTGGGDGGSVEASAAEPAPSSGANATELSDEEKDVLGEISNICMGTAATTLFSLVNQKVSISTPKVKCCTWADLIEEYDTPCVFINIDYVEGIKGNNLLILLENDVKCITDLMMGGDGTNLADELSELHLSAICEAMNQMMGSASTSMSSMLDKKIDISPPRAERLVLKGDTGSLVSQFEGKDFVKVALRMEIGDLVDSNIMQLYPIDFARDLYKAFASSLGAEPTSEPTPPPQAAPQQAPAPAPQAAPQPAPQPAPQAPPQGMPYGMPPYGVPPYGYPPMQDVNVQPVQFQTFAPGINPVTQAENIDLIMDVPLEVTVELGRTKKSIKEILDFAPGTIIELDKIAGEPIDVLVNGKLVAKGEVVVIEESFGIRVTDIIKTKVL